MPPAEVVAPPVEAVAPPVEFAGDPPWRQRLWHLLWVVPLLGIGAALASPPDRTGPPPQILAFDVQPAAARPGAAVTLTWSVEGAENVRLDPLPGREVPAVGRQTLPAPETTTSFRLTATAYGQTRSATVQLEVAPAPPEVLLFEAQPTEIAVGEAALLTWNVSGDGVVVQIEPGDGSQLGANGSVILHPTTSTAYTLVARNAVGEAVARTEVRVGAIAPPDAPRVRRFEVVSTRDAPATPGAGAAGGTMVLGWSVTGAESIELSGGATATGLTPEGSIEVAAPEWTTVYYLTARGPGGTTLAELTVAGTAEEPGRVPSPPPRVVQPVLSGDPGVAAVPPDSVNNGNVVDGVIAETGGEAFAQLAPVVETFAVSPVHARLGDEVVVRWAVAGADQVTVRLDPTEPGVAPLTTPAGVFRFVATRDLTVVLEATNVAGTVVRRQVAFAVRTFDPEATGVDIPGGVPRLLVAGEAGGGTVLVAERGQVWHYRDRVWRWAGRVPVSAAGSPAAAALVGPTLFVAGADGRVRTLDLSGLAAPVARLDPWRAVLATGEVELGTACRRVVGLAGFSVVDPVTAAGGGGILVVACADPAALVSFTVRPDGQVDTSPAGLRWTHQLDAPPSALVGTPRPGTGDGTLAVRYPVASGFSTRVDLFAASTGWTGSVTAPGAVVAAAPGADGNVVAAAVAGEAAIYVLDRRGVAARRVDLPAEVASLTWQAALEAPAVAGETPRLAPVEAVASPVTGAPPPRSEAVAPPPVPESADPDAAAIGASPGWLLVTWLDQPGGALVALAPWSSSPVVASLLPDRALVALVDDGGAIVGASASPSRASAFPWLAAGGRARRDDGEGGP